VEPVEETLLLGLRLEPVVAIYAVCVAVTSIWLLVDLLRFKHAGQGWLFLSGGEISIVSTWWVEIFVYVFSAVTATVAAAAILSNCIMRLRKDGPRSPWRASFKRRITMLMLVFFVASALRFSLSLLITGIAVFARDLCGLHQLLRHATSLQDRSVDSPISRSVLPHCSASDVHQLLVAALVMIIDGYMVWACLLLWQRLRAQCAPLRAGVFHKDDLTCSLEQAYGHDYGAAGSSPPMTRLAD